MKRATVGLLGAAILLLGAAAPVAAGHVQGCNKPFAPIELRTDYAGGGVPTAGVDAWWDLTVAGFAAEGLTVAQAAELFGFGADVDGLYEWVLAGILALDANEDGWVCWKPFPPQQNGTPLYIILVSDNKHIK